MMIYPDEQKAKLIERMLPPGEEPVPALSCAIGIPKDTLYGWRRQGSRESGTYPEQRQACEQTNACQASKTPRSTASAG